MQSPSYTIVLIIVSIVWFLIVIIQFKLALLMVILSAILSYDAIWIDLQDFDNDQDSNAKVQGKIIFVCDNCNDVDRIIGYSTLAIDKFFLILILLSILN